MTRSAVLAVAEIFVCSGIPTQILIANVLALAGLAPPDAHPTVAFVAALLLSDTAIVVTLMVLLTRTHGESIRSLWLGRGPWSRELVLGTALIPVVFLVVAVLLTTLRFVAPGLHSVPDNPLEALARQGRYASLLFGVVVIVGGGLREELQRAFMLRRFEEHLGGGTVGVVVLSIAFGLGHFEQGWDAMVTTGVIGAIWAVLYRWRRSSIAPIVSHAGFNALEVLRVAVFNI